MLYLITFASQFKHSLHTHINAYVCMYNCICNIYVCMYLAHSTKSIRLLQAQHFVHGKCLSVAGVCTLQIHTHISSIYIQIINIVYMYVCITSYLLCVCHLCSFSRFVFLSTYIHTNVFLMQYTSASSSSPFSFSLTLQLRMRLCSSCNRIILVIIRSFSSSKIQKK